MKRSASRFLLVAVLTAVAVPATAQVARVYGTVTDSRGEPLPGVNVVLKGTLTGTATAEDGSYEIPRVEPGPWIIVASAVGFRSEERPVTLVAGSGMRVDFALEEDIVVQGEVVVTASRRAQAAVDVPASVAVLSPRDLDRRNVISLDDALRAIPGVHLQENQVNVRGSSGFAYNTGSRVLMLLDGMPILTPDTDGVAFDALPFGRIERIEVLKGPGSALYGSGALGGVVNVITRPIPDEPETEVRTYAGAWDRVRYDVWRAGWDGADRYRVFSGVSIAHARRLSRAWGAWVNLSARQDEGYLNYSRSRMVTGYGKVAWNPSSDVRTSLLVGLLVREKDNFLFWNGARDPLNPGSLAIAPPDGAAPTGSNDVFGNQLSVLPTVTHVTSGRFAYTVKGRLFGTVIRPINDVTGKPEPASRGTLGFRYGGEVQANWSPARGSEATFGVARDALATRSTFYVTENGDDTGGQPETAVFGQWEQDVSPVVRTTAGLRYDRYDVDEANAVERVSPKLGVTWRALPQGTLRLAYGHGFRVPSLAERFTDNRDFFPIVRNPTLRPERSVSYETGFRTTRVVAGAWSVEVDAAAFWNEYWDLIEPRLETRVRAFQFVNLTRARIRGFEASADVRREDRGDLLRLGYTWLDADDLSLGEALAFRSRHQFTASLDVRVTGPWEVGADARLMSAAERVDTDFARFVPDADLLVPIRVVDFRAGWNGGTWRAAVLVQNAFDYYYAERPAYLAATRRFTVQVAARF